MDLKKRVKKNVVRVGPPLTKLLDPRMHDENIHEVHLNETADTIFNKRIVF